MKELESLRTAVVEGKRNDALALLQALRTAGLPAQQILDEALVPAMATVGDLVKQGEYYIPEMLVAARAMKLCVAQLRSELEASNVQPLARVIVCTVRGDLHDIGKSLVTMMLEGAGFEVIDLGVDCEPARIVAAIGEHQAQLVCLSALLTTTMLAMRDTIEAIRAAGLRSGVGVLIGGASVTQAYADEIGADGYAADAASAVDTARAVLARLPAAGRTATV